jgi:hypothetical protein
MMQPDRAKGFYLFFLIATLVGFPLHEAAHWAMGEALGHEMTMSLNRAAAVARDAASPFDAVLIAAAGPVLTIGIGLIGYVWARASAHWFGYALLYAAWFERLAAAFVSLFHPNDEARIGMILGIGKWTLPAIVVLGLSVLLVDANRRLRIGWKINAALYVLSSLLVAAVVFVDAA